MCAFGARGLSFASGFQKAGKIKPQPFDRERETAKDSACGRFWIVCKEGANAAQTLFDHHSVNCEITPVVVIDAASFADRWSTFETNPDDEQGLGALLAQVWGL